ncbi:Presenilin [Opisthorchis viverrini]|uniref:Presenilin n=1 Tax=Opisthorchis viverrini TaxID=6198 RepID=A0A1S8X4V0_OPIVI|nr:Presenilin [Opisthorchis viverrini]
MADSNSSNALSQPPTRHDDSYSQGEAPLGASNASFKADELLVFGAKQVIREIIRAMGIFVDYITMAFILWNFGVVGMVVIHWRGPLVLQQAYLIFISAQIALMFLKYLPKWTCWVLLGALAVWVTICMFFVVLVATTVDYYASTETYLIYTPFHTPDADLGTRTWQTIANTLIFMSVIIVMTCVLVLLFKYQCYRFIHGWLILTTFMLLFLISFLFFTEIIRAMGIFVDYITMAFILWNFGVVGMVVIHWRGPLVLQQAYLIFISAQIALMFLKYLPKWTCWVLLGALAVWDLVAVLCPRGPLRMLVEMAHEREQPLFPALLYSTTAVYLITASTGANANGSEAEGSDSTAEVPLMSEYRHSTGGQQNSSDLPSTNVTTSEQLRERHLRRMTEPIAEHSGNSTDAASRWRQIHLDLRDREERGVKLGLGDFVFYSLLIGRAALDGDVITVATCYVAILVGMCVTIIVLGITRRALPALPVSVACGILFYFVTSTVISPFLQVVAVGRLVF